MAKLSDLVPGSGWAKWAAYAVGALLLAGLAYLAVYRLFFQGQELKREQANRVVAEEQVMAESNIVEGTMGAIREREVYREHVTTVVREGTKEVNNAWNGEQVGEDVDTAGAAALCGLHDSLCRHPSPEVMQQVR